MTDRFPNLWCRRLPKSAGHPISLRHRSFPAPHLLHARRGLGELRWSLDVCGEKFQRDFVSKPRVARHELPWVRMGEKGLNPNGVVAAGNRSDATPLGLAQVWGRCPQGRRDAPTLGFGTESRWDSRPDVAARPSVAQVNEPAVSLASKSAGHPNSLRRRSFPAPHLLHAASRLGGLRCPDRARSTAIIYSTV